MDTLTITPVDLALHRLPVPADLPQGSFTVSGCRLQMGIEHIGQPVDAEDPPCQELWSPELTWSSTEAALDAQGNLLWRYELTRDYNETQTKFAVDMTFEAKEVRLAPTHGELRYLTCHNSKAWQLIPVGSDAHGLFVADKALTIELRRGPGCEAEVEVSGTLYRVPVHQEVTFEVLASMVVYLGFAAAPAAFAVTMLLRWYLGQRVKKTMAASGPKSVPPPPEPVSNARSMLRFETLGASASASTDTQIDKRAKRSIYILTCGALLCSAVLGVTKWLVDASNASWKDALVLAMAFSWLLVPMMAATMSIRRRTLLAAGSVHVALYFLIACVMANKSALDAAKVLPINLVSAVPLAFVCWPRLRGIGPWGLLACWAGFAALAVPFVLFTGPTSPALVLTSRLGEALGIPNGIMLYALAALFVLVIIAPPTWLALRGLSRAYRVLRLNDRLVMAGCLWAIHVLFMCLLSVHLGSRAMLWSLLALPVAGAFPFLFSQAPANEKPLRLVFLRAFEGRKDQADVFPNLRSLLGHRFQVELIAGPDLASSLLQPEELLDFVSGKLSRAYLQTSEAANARLALSPPPLDAEGRYPFQQFFCANGVWKEVFAALAKRADVALIDLRGLSEKRDGCSYELTQLIQRVPLRRTIVLTDKHTDHELLRKVALAAWSNLPPDSPNVALTEPTLAFFQYDARASDDMGRLIRHIARIADTTESIGLHEEAESRQPVETFAAQS